MNFNKKKPEFMRPFAQSKEDKQRAKETRQRLKDDVAKHLEAGGKVHVASNQTSA